MKKFFSNSMILVTLALLTVMAMRLVVAPMIRNPNDYLGATIDKEKRLDTLCGPRLVFVGGSNLSFGIDSKLIERECHYSVVNMSMHGGLGLTYVLKEAIAGIKESDIVILSIEYYLAKPDMKLASQLIDINPAAKKYFAFSAEDLLLLYVSDLQRCISSSAKILIQGKYDPIYRRDGLTKEGDVISHLEVKNETVAPSRLSVKDYKSNLQEINNFVDTVKKRKAIVYFMYPAYQKSSYRLSEKDVMNFAALMEKQLKCDIINDPNTFVYNDILFFNTKYHLNKNGRKLRTEKLIDILKEKVL